MKRPAFFSRSELAAALWSFRREFLVVAVFSAVANLLTLTPTLYMIQVFDRVMASGSELTLLSISFICLFLFCVLAVSEWARSRVLVRLGVRLDEMLGTRVFNASFESYLAQTGASPARAFSDLLLVRQFITGNGVFAFVDAPWTPIYILVMFFLHPWLGIFALVCAAIQLTMAFFGQRGTVDASEAAIRTATESNLYLQGKLRSVEVLESMGMVDNLRSRWHERYMRYLAASGRSFIANNKVGAWNKGVRYAQQSLALAMGALLVIRGEMSAGSMIAANMLVGRALQPIEMMIASWRGFVSAREAFARLEALMRDFPERDPALHRVAPRGELALGGVLASAPGRVSPILKQVSFSAAPGTVTCVLGPSGSGKSTLARVIMGIWPDRAGEVLIDGLPIEGWDRMELGPHVGYLPQDVELFDGTIAENIARFGEVDSGKVIEAARCAGLHEMILRYPAGYDTQIGDGGSMLSGGQRQRIALARAVYGNPALIVLDEPNSNLDDAGETALVKAVAQLKQRGATVVLITHRPSVIGVADRLVLLKDGSIVADGPRQAVIAALQRPAAVTPAATSAETA